MLNIPPWRLLKPNGPVNKPDSTWFNAVTRILSTISVRVGDGEQPYIDRPNNDGSFWSIVLPSSLIDPNEQAHFRVDQVSSTSVQVHGGRWTRRAGGDSTTVLLNVDGGGTSGDFADVATITDVTTTRWLCLYIGNAIAPTQMYITEHATYPTDDSGMILRPIAKVTCASSVITEIEQLDVGDIDDAITAPDNVSLDFGGGLTASAVLQIYGWATASAVSSLDAGDLFVFKRVAGDGTANYASLSQLRTDIGSAAIGSVAQGDFTGWLDTWFETWAADSHDHSSHSESSFANNDHDYLVTGRTGYWLSGGDYNRCFSGSIGSDSGTTAITLTPADNGGGWMYRGLTGNWLAAGDFGANGIFYNAGLAGVTISGWTSGGIFVDDGVGGTNIVTKHVKLVDADTEETISGTVLFIAD